MLIFSDDAGTESGLNQVRFELVNIDRPLILLGRQSKQGQRSYGKHCLHSFGTLPTVPGAH